jgi:acetyltransferase-like isoleucine patch superfamily enzyme
MVMKILGTAALSAYELIVRLRNKTFSLLVASSFAGFGAKTVLALPIRLGGVSRIAIGGGVFVGGGSWLQTLTDGDNADTALTIGSGTSIAGNCVISAVRNVHLEEAVLLARNVYISDHSHRYSDQEVPILEQGIEQVKPVLIKAGAWLGQNVVVCPGVTIGRGAVIGANSVVTRDVPDFSVAAGAPARVVKIIPKVCKP